MLVDGSGTGSGCRGVACHRPASSGDRLVLLWGSSGWMGACSPISGVIVSPAGIYWPATGSVNSFPFVGSGGWFWFWWWMRRYAPLIWCDDMRRRYGATICTTDMQGRKTEKAKSNTLLAPDVVYFCDSLLYFCCSIHLIIFPISVGTMRARKSSSCTRPMCFIFVSHS